MIHQYLTPTSVVNTYITPSAYGALLSSRPRLYPLSSQTLPSFPDPDVFADVEVSKCQPWDAAVTGLLWASVLTEHVDTVSARGFVVEEAPMTSWYKFPGIFVLEREFVAEEVPKSSWCIFMFCPVTDIAC
jgi:hypothetical protein